MQKDDFWDLQKWGEKAIFFFDVLTKPQCKDKRNRKP